MAEEARDQSKSVSAKAGLARKFYETLIALEFAPAESLRILQGNVLRDLLEHVAAHNMFYRERLAPVIDGKGRADLTHWQKVPILTAEQVAAYHAELRAPNIPKQHGRIFRYQSSGTTGRSLAYYRSELDELAARCGQYRHLQAIGVGWGKDLALIRAFDPALQRFRGSRSPGDPRPETWGPSWIDHEQLGTIHRLSVFAPLEEQIAWLNRLGEIYLNTFPSNALALARFVKKTGVARPKLLAILTAGEPITSDERHEVATGLGCPCFDVISNAELGAIACECPSHQGYHLQSELTLIELLDERNRRVKEGQWGRVVTTPLYNFAMPLIRYDTGDWAKLKGTCSCGRHHALIDPVYGRPSNLLRVGKSAWMRPDPAAEQMDKYLPECRWQLVLTSPRQVELRYMRCPANTTIDASAAKRYVGSFLGPRISIAIREVVALGPSASGKFPAFVSQTGQT